VFLIGSDHSAELTAIARVRATPQSERNLAGSSDSAGASSVLCADACVADGLSLPHPRDRFDFVISVAVVHHFATRERRVEAVAALLDTVRQGTSAEHTKDQVADAAANMAAKIEGGRVLICVWALEQRNSRRGWDRGMEQDVLVPWVMKSGRRNNDSLPGEQTFQRYYHLYREGELEEDVQTAGGRVLENGYEADNWWVIAARPSLGHTSNPRRYGQCPGEVLSNK
jgi:tRNA (uracil-5-)-methyltransferase TRM9